MQTRAVLFDKDGTLLDFGSMWLPAYRAAAAWIAELIGDPLAGTRLLVDTGYDANAAVVLPGSLLACGSNGELITAWAKFAGVPSDDIEGPIAAIFGHHSAQAPTPITDLRQLFTGLRSRGLSIGVATMDTTAGARSGLGALDLLDLLDVVMGFDAGHGAKPGPGMVLAFAEAVGAAPRDVAVVGDSVHDLAMARNAGAGQAIGVLSGTTPREGLAPWADDIIGSVADLETVLR